MHGFDASNLPRYVCFKDPLKGWWETSKIRLVNVSKSFGDIKALKNVNLEVESGEYVTVLGPTSAGKTTLLRVIAGTIHPDEGEIYIDGKLMNDVPPEKRNIGYFPQTYALFPHLTVIENVAYGLIVRGYSREDAYSRAMETLKLVGLSGRPNSYPMELSGGMQQRVALARAITTPSKLLLLDEPLSALDAIIRLNLKFKLRELANKLNLTVIHVTHDQEVALSISDKTVIMRSGIVEQVGSPVEIFENPKNIYVANFVGEMNFFPGVVINELNSHVAVDIGGIILKARKRAEIKGREAVVAIRPENLKVASELRGENTVKAVVKSVSFSSAIYRYEISVENGLSLIYKEPFIWGVRPHRIGEEISVYLDPEKTLVYPYPAEGLEMALSLE